MPQQITDLSTLVPDDKRVRIGTKVYAFPGDPPMEIFLRLMKLQERFAEAEAEASINEVIVELQELVLNLMQIKQPTLKALPPGIGPQGLMAMITALYSDEAPAVDPPKAAGKKKKPPSKAARKSGY